MEAALSVSDESGVHVWDALALNPGLYCCFGFDDTARGEHYLAQFRQRVRGERDLDRAFYLHFSAYRDWLLGRTTAAEQQLRDAIRAADKAGLLYAIIYYRIGLSRVLADRGAIEEAHSVLAEAQRSAARVGGDFLPANLGLVRASIAVVAGTEPDLQELARDMERAARNAYVILPWVCRADWSELIARTFSSRRSREPVGRVDRATGPHQELVPAARRGSAFALAVASPRIDMRGIARRSRWHGRHDRSQGGQAIAPPARSAGDGRGSG